MNTIGLELSENGNISKIIYNPNSSNKVIEITKEELNKVMNSSIAYKNTFKELENKYLKNES